MWMWSWSWVLILAEFTITAIASRSGVCPSAALRNVRARHAASK